ncbi:MAG TPA: 50S ribosomal protein L13 [Actinomycetota bacterium]|nr:50S ribosomal protein L13 [Actinomycetota bacterium]
MKTHSTKPSEITREWHLVDAEGVVLGRLASEVAKLLRGKHKPNFAPHLDCGDHVIVVNASKIVLTGDKLLQKEYHRHSGYPGGLRSIPYSKLLAERPELVIEKAVKGMLPHNRLGRQMIKKLKVYAGSEHPHGAQSPKTLDLKPVAAPHDPDKAHTIEEVVGG